MLCYSRQIGSEEKSEEGAEDDEANQRALNKPNGGEEIAVTQEALSRVQFETSPKQKHRKPVCLFLTFVFHFC